MIRCDRCGHRAKVEWAKGSMTLTFCNHHSAKYEVGLTTQGWGRTDIAPVDDAKAPYQDLGLVGVDD